MRDKLRVLFVHIDPVLSSFVQRDIDILSEEYDVRVVAYKTRFDIWKILKGTLWADVTFSWFAWDQAAWAVRFSRLFNRRSIVVAGGFDVVNMPEIAYGNLTSPSNAARTLYAIRNASKVISVSNSIKKDAERFSNRQDIENVYHGFDSEQFTPGDRKEPFALTVGAVNRSTLKRKGIEAFIKAAEIVPDMEFHLVGSLETDLAEELRESASANLHILGRVPYQKLIEEMRRAAVYVQVSAHEGFGCSLAEAMLCGCVPVVSNRGSIPEVVGETGIFVEYDDTKATAKGIRKALENPNLGVMARERIVQLFPLSNRRTRLKELVEEISRK